MNARQRLDSQHARGKHVASPIPDECFGCDAMRRVAHVEPTRATAPYGPQMIHLVRDGATLCGRRAIDTYGGAWTGPRPDQRSKCLRCARTRNAERDMMGAK